MRLGFPRPTRRRTSLVASLALLVGAMSFVTVPSATAADALISQGKTATASSTQPGLPAADAVDGNTATRWGSLSADPQWLQIDLGATASISQVVLRWEAAYGKSFDIQTAASATGPWTSIYTTTTGAGGVQTLPVTGSGRFVRMYGTVRGTGYGYSLYEFQVIGSFATTPATCGTSNFAQGKAATASSVVGGNTAALAVDGNTGSRWESLAADPQWLRVDLGTTQSICRVVINWETAAAKSFQLQTSNDGTTWTNIYTTTTSTGGNQSIDVTGSGRYIRMNGTVRTTGYGYSIWEFQVMVGGGGGTINPTGATVEVVGSPGNWRLLVQGQPYYVKGLTWGPSPANSAQYMGDLVATGANTIRTWGTDASSKQLFDTAAANRVRVVAGFWLQPGGGPGSGGCPSYVTDTTYKTDSMNTIKQWVTAYKDHAAILMWSVGNESLLGMKNCWTGQQLEDERNAYARFVNDVAKEIKIIDKNHPVSSTDAWTGAWPYYERNSPALDLLQVNSYGDVCGIEPAYKAGGYTRPYLVTEGGPAGEWEVPNDNNGVPAEPTDVQKANGYTTAWNCITGAGGDALGATLFHFGTEFDFGGVYFNLFNNAEKRLSYYSVAKAYGGPAGAAGVNTPPVISNMTVPTVGVQYGSRFTVRASISDPNNDPLTYEVRLSGRYADKGDALVPAAFTRNADGSFDVTAPEALGVWKVYIIARDGRGNIGIETKSIRVVANVQGTNIALNKPATASSFDPYNGNFTPGQAFDGNNSTRWASAWSDPQWIQVDLGSVQSFNRIQLIWEGAYGSAYRIETSNDGTTWRLVTSVTGGNGGVDLLENAGSGRYVRLTGTQRGTGFGYSLFEFGVYAG